MSTLISISFPFAIIGFLMAAQLNKEMKPLKKRVADLERSNTPSQSL